MSNSTGTVTVNSSGGNLIGTVYPGTCAHLLCVGTTLTTAADWDFDYISFSTVTGTGNAVLSASPTLTGTATVSALTASSTLTANSTITLSGSASSTTSIGTSATTGTTTIGGTSQTGTIIVGRSTVTQTTELASGVTSTGNIKTVNIGTGGAAGSTTNVNIGSGSGGTTTVNKDLVVSGNLTVNGTTTTVNSTTVTVDDPVFTLGGDTAPASDDNKDRGIEFRWHNGTAAKVGFFGFSDSTGKFTFIPDATNTSEVFSGTKGTIDASIDWADVLNKPDPVSELNAELWKTGLDSDKDTVRKQKRRLTYTSNILVVNDPAHPENNGKVKLFKFGNRETPIDTQTLLLMVLPWASRKYMAKDIIKKLNNETCQIRIYFPKKYPLDVAFHRYYHECTPIIYKMDIGKIKKFTQECKYNEDELKRNISGNLFIHTSRQTSYTNFYTN